MADQELGEARPDRERPRRRSVLPLVRVALVIVASIAMTVPLAQRTQEITDKLGEESEAFRAACEQVEGNYSRENTGLFSSQDVCTMPDGSLVDPLKKIESR